MTPIHSSAQPSRLRISVSKRALSAATVAILGLSTVQVAAPEMSSAPVASAAPQNVAGKQYNDNAPQNVPWDAVAQSNQYGNLLLSLNAVEKAGVAKSDKYGNWGSPVPLDITDGQNQTIYRSSFTDTERPVPFNNSNTLPTPLGEWSYTAQDSKFSVTWRPAPGYIGYAPPLPIEISSDKNANAKNDYDFATVGQPGKETEELTSTGAFGGAQTAQARNGFPGVRDGMGWAGFAPKYAFQVVKGDDVASKAGTTPNYAKDGDGNHLGFVTTELTTSEGTYRINPDSGEISFTPGPKFFTSDELKDTNLTRKSAAPIRVIVSNMTTNKSLGEQRVMPFGQTRPAHTIDRNNPSYAEVSTIYTPNVVKPTVGLNNASTTDRAGREVTLKPDFAQSSGQAAIDKDTIELVNAAGKKAGKALVVRGEGTWSVNRDGSVTFTPEVGFLGDPTPIQYTAQNELGVSAGMATLSVGYEIQSGLLASTIGEQGKAQKSTDSGEGDWGLDAQKMFPGYPKSWYDKFTYALVTPGGEVVARDTALQIRNVGRYDINKNTGEVTFTPDPSFSGAAPAVGVRITNLRSANGQGIPEDGIYRPIVSTTNMVLRPVSASGEVGEKLTATPKYERGMDRGSVRINGADANSNGKTKTIPNQGTWSVDRDGAFTFVPVDGFFGNPDPVDYTVANGDGVRSEPGTVLGEYAAVKTAPSTSNGDANQPQTSKPGKEMFPSFPDNWTITYSLAGAVENVLAREEGMYTIDPNTGVVTFEPARGYSGTPAAVTVEATTKTGATQSTTYQVSVNAAPSKSPYPVSMTTTPPQATITAFPEGMTETVTLEPITVTPDPITTTVPVTGEPTTITATPAPVTTTVPDVTTTIKDAPTTVAVPPVTVTPEPVTVTATPNGDPVITVTPAPITATPDPINVTLGAAPMTTTVDGNTLEITDKVIKVTPLPGNPFAVKVSTPDMEEGSLRFTGVAGISLPPEISQDMREMKVPEQGRWIIDSGSGEVIFFPERKFKGDISRAELAYKRKDGSEHNFSIEADYPKAGRFGKTPKPEDPTKVDEPTTTEETTKAGEPTTTEESTKAQEPGIAGTPSQVNEPTTTNKSSKPNEPTKASQPASPSQPTKASQPATASESSKPKEPSQPASPSQPTKASQPATASESSKPKEPSQPTKASQPATASESSKPKEPSQPTKASQPASPSQPTKASQPAPTTKPNEPTKASQPAPTTKPNAPAKPSQPAKPNTPTKRVPDASDAMPLLWLVPFRLFTAGFGYYAGPMSGPYQEQLDSLNSYLSRRTNDTLRRLMEQMS
nr:cell wall surface anchor family protein [Streptococcus thermophilus]